MEIQIFDDQGVAGVRLRTTGEDGLNQIAKSAVIRYGGRFYLFQNFVRPFTVANFVLVGDPVAIDDFVVKVGEGKS